MPELPEVETVRRGLTKSVVGQTITEIEIRYFKIIVGNVQEFRDRLLGATITDIGRRAKYLLFHFDNGWTMVSHLRMEGRYQLRAEKSEFDKHVHVIFSLSNGQYLAYRDVRKFGKMQLVPRGSELNLKSIAALGPEPLTPEYTSEALRAGLSERRKSIKATLLDQHVVSGLGNIYADEVLWQSRINPQEPANNLSATQLTTLYQAINTEIKRAIDAGGTTVHSYVNADGQKGTFQGQLQVYQHTGEACPRCGNSIAKIKVAGRGTHYCPVCQPLNS
ncbi:bifunctional DNA-formamidopyrimidine glycosylase/DNA-(apurinic or apyrimidinic site) lyase [Lactobacillus sp. DCY120]|uniref:Formamidopyrimidine-DNA glycosylase n=1 Tax=Bombilactobacillus apium TaxID=2675299 RepID=A0A850R1B2_9LACO|nr:bifunctional DNA-formamidopyrimidine glycosylase/DNA-(apurinic or apyrimidinic site) lyase [Bombilactobacillus apium]NVY96889.1 bifunctional DNA-formamidopyrimidine glycosylase/DNA-(apurinic or apyrimidinic site) lyase [Bombilactobacillus apium]